MSITASDLVERCAKKLGAYYTSVASATYDMDFWEYNDWVEYVSDAYRDIISSTGWQLGTTTVTLVADTTNQYAFPTGIAETLSMVYDPDDKAIQLKIVDTTHMGIYHGGSWEQTEGDVPYLAVIKDSVADGVYTKIVQVYPEPEDEKTLEIEYVPSQEITALTDELQVPDSYFVPLMYKILSYAYQKSGEEGDLRESKFNEMEYLTRLNDLHVDVISGRKNVTMPTVDYL